MLQQSVADFFVSKTPWCSHRGYGQNSNLHRNIYRVPRRGLKIILHKYVLVCGSVLGLIGRGDRVFWVLGCMGRGVYYSEFGRRRSVR